MIAKARTHENRWTEKLLVANKQVDSQLLDGSLVDTTALVDQVAGLLYSSAAARASWYCGPAHGSRLAGVDVAGDTVSAVTTEADASSKKHTPRTG